MSLDWALEVALPHSNTSADLRRRCSYSRWLAPSSRWPDDRGLPVGELRFDEFHRVVKAKGFTVSQWRVLSTLASREPLSSRAPRPDHGLQAADDHDRAGPDGAARASEGGIISPASAPKAQSLSSA
jgi:hypothetical protein